MRKIFLVVILFVLISCNSYKRENLLKINNYNYNIEIPESWSVSRNVNKYNSIIFSAFGEEFDKSSDGNYFIHNVSIYKKGFDGAIYVYFINKDSVVYNDLMKEKNKNIKVIFLDYLNGNNKIRYSEIVSDWIKDKYVPKILFFIEKDYLLLFELRSVMFSASLSYSDNGSENRNSFDYSLKSKKKILKEYCNIVNSLTREKIK